VADHDVRPPGWCARCNDQHSGDARCWAYTQPPTASTAALEAYGRVIVDMLDDRPQSEASPEVLDLLAEHLTALAATNRRRRAADATGGAR
jgi:hypothetical protein